MDLAREAALAAARLAREGGPWEPRAWSKQEESACMARAMAGQRTRSESRISRAIEDFGGIPPCVDWTDAEGSSRVPTMELAARDPSGFGFELFAEGARDGRDMKDWLGLGLRGAPGSLGGSETFVSVVRASMEGARSQTGPVAACFKLDNAPALARLMSMPDCAQALLEMEPEPAPNAWLKGSWPSRELACENARGFHDERIERAAYLERSLLWQAISARAWSCAGMLLEMAPFASVLSKGELGAAWGERSGGGEGVFWAKRQGVWEALAGEESGVRRPRGPGSTPEKRARQERRLGEVLNVALRMWELSPAGERERPDQAGIYAGEKVALKMWRLGFEELAREAATRFEAAGCPIDWQALGARMVGDNAARMREFCLARAERVALASQAPKSKKSAKAAL